MADGWLVVNHKTGLKDGSYARIEEARKAKKVLERRYPKLAWEVVQGQTVPDSQFHAYPQNQEKLTDAS